MRIALVVHKFPPSSVGGTEVYTLNLARGLATRGHEVFVFYRDDRSNSDGTWETREGFRAFRVSGSLSWKIFPLIGDFLATFWNPDVEKRFMQFMEEVRPHLVHFQHLMSLSFRLVKQAKLWGLPTVLTLHDYWFLCGNAQLIWPDGRICHGKAGGWNCSRCALASRVHPPAIWGLRPAAAALLRIRDHLVWKALFQADQLIAPSRFLIREYVRAGVPPERIIYLENGVDLPRLRGWKRRPSTDGRIRFTYIGALAWQKGVHVIIEAFRGLPADRAILRIYGDPTRFPQYVAQLRQRADPTNTFFEGPVPNEEIGRVLSETDVLLVPSLWYENSPVVIQEALAVGIPVMASDRGALAEKVRPGVNGWLCPPGDVQAWRSRLQALIREGSPGEGLRIHESTPLSLEEHISCLEEIYQRLFDCRLCN